ncbi:MAG: GNAT family N-acetyltransferase [Arenicella sp.]|nr:GNAT family N-acetyltransferase [Arenicella sp.]
MIVDFSDDAVVEMLVELLHAHRQDMLKYSPPESVHALGIDAIKSSNLTFWSASIGMSNQLGRSTHRAIIACAALNMLSEQHVELKSMKVSDAYLGQGIGRVLLNHVLAYAKRIGYQRVSLETGTMPVFVPARRLYESAGFEQCAPFSNYVYDQNSVCMSLNLGD